MARRQKAVRMPPPDFLDEEAAPKPLPLCDDQKIQELIVRKRKFIDECEKSPYFIINTFQSTEYMSFRAVFDAVETRKKAQHNIHWDKEWAQNIHELMPQKSKCSSRRRSKHGDAKLALRSIKADLENANDEDVDDAEEEDVDVFEEDDDDDGDEGNDYTNSYFDNGEEEHEDGEGDDEED